ncbi:hypothetical protein DFH09DRAFT_1103150 [Mycena vulgaris]|nr:hypothetical protein DFH09DRAFT_1103150 [Mycena vulgaris]
MSNGQLVFPTVANTASLSSFPSSRNNPQTLVLSSPKGFGLLYYPFEVDECPPFGVCSDGTRWVGWPDTGPVVIFRGGNGSADGYTFITRTHLSGLSAINTPNYSLYHIPQRAWDGLPDANFLRFTVPNPEGPWTAPKVLVTEQRNATQQFFTGVPGMGSLPAYSTVVHPNQLYLHQSNRYWDGVRSATRTGGLAVIGQRWTRHGILESR